MKNVNVHQNNRDIQIKDEIHRQLHIRHIKNNF